jgi:hypothetical protein
VDLTIIWCALTGFVVGFVSLYLMQSLVARIYGSLSSWLFIVGVAGLSGSVFISDASCGLTVGTSWHDQPNFIMASMPGPPTRWQI